MPIALLAGAFGQGNLGDEILLEAFVRAAPGWHFAVTTTDPATAERVGCLAVPAHHAGAVAGAASRADAVVVGGGAVFKTLHPSTARPPHALLANTAALVAASCALHHPVAMMGVGAGELASRRARALTRLIVRHTDLLVLRDEESAAEIAGSGAPGPFRVGADAAWTLLEPPDEIRAADSSSVRVVPSTLAAGTDGWTGMVDRLASGVRQLRSSGFSLQLQAWQVPDDVAIVDELVRRLGPPVEVVPTPESLRAAVESMAGLAAVVSFRFHALVAAGGAGVPSVAVTHETKLGALARRLEQRAIAPGFEPGDLVAAVTAAVAAPGPAPAAIKEQVGRAHEQFRLLRVLLAAGRSEEADFLGALPFSPALTPAEPSPPVWPT